MENLPTMKNDESLIHLHPVASVIEPVLKPTGNAISENLLAFSIGKILEVYESNSSFKNPGEIIKEKPIGIVAPVQRNDVLQAEAPVGGSASLLDTVPPSLMSIHGACDINVVNQPYVVVQHDTNAKASIDATFSADGHIVFPTDQNYTGMLWNTQQNVTDIFNKLKTPGVQHIFMPFTIRKWPRQIDRPAIKNYELYQAAVNQSDYLNSVVEKFRHRELFGHLDLTRLNVAVKVHCFWGDASPQTIRIKNELCWVLQYKANRNKLCWKVFNHESDNSCDIIIVITISKKCFITGIQVKKRQRRLPSMYSITGMCLIWPFLHAAESFKVVDFKLNGESQTICLLTHKENISAFWLVNIKTPDGGPNKNACWLPLKWKIEHIHELFDKVISSGFNRKATEELLSLQDFLKTHMEANLKETEDLSITSNWVA